MFQSTPSREGDLVTADAPTTVRRFNPRPRARATDVAVNTAATVKVSIHALARGRPPRRVYIIGHFVEFQSTPSREGDRPASPWPRSSQ